MRSPGHRVAAIGEAEGHARGQAADRDRALLLGPLVGLGQVGGAAGDQRLHHRRVGELGRADREHQVFLGREAEPLDRRGERLLADLGGQPLGDLVVQLAADRGDFLAFLVRAPSGGSRRAPCR